MAPYTLVDSHRSGRHPEPKCSSFCSSQLPFATAGFVGWLNLRFLALLGLGWGAGLI